MRWVVSFGGDKMKHKMILEEIHPNTMEEWYCPICGRRVLITRPDSPNGYHKVVLVSGNENAKHAGIEGELDDPRLGVFKRFLRGLGT